MCFDGHCSLSFLLCANIYKNFDIRKIYQIFYLYLYNRLIFYLLFKITVGGQIKDNV